MRIETYVDATPITTLQRQESAAAETGDKPNQVRGEVRGAAQEVECMLWGIPEPLRSIGVEREGSWGQCGKADFYKWKYRDLRTIAQERHRKLPPRYKGFHQGRLAIRCQYIGNALRNAAGV
jgi:hypothetical protein